MPIPNIQVFLFTPTIPGGVDLAPLLSQDSNPNLSILIEDPTGTNNFMTGDVSLKGYDAPNGTTVSGYFAGMLPTSKDFTILISMSIVPPGGVAYVGDMLFQGYVDPNSLQFVPNLGEFSFTVIGNARKLQADASGLFQRTGYFDGKWSVYSDVSKLDTTNPSISVFCTPPQFTPDFYTFDEIQILTGDRFIVTNVLPDIATSPPAFWKLYVATAPSKNYAVGSAVNLKTPYLRNQKLEDVVSTLFSAAGFPNKQYFFSAPLPNLVGGFFSSPMNTNGLPGGAGVGIAVAAETGGKQIVVSGPNGAFLAPDATSGFSLVVSTPGFRQPPVDPTNYGTTLTMFGAKRTLDRSPSPEFGLDVLMKFYAYDHLNGHKRYVLTVSSQPQADGTFIFAQFLEVQTDSGGWIWGSTATVVSWPAHGTSTDLSGSYDAIGIDVDPATGTLFFTDIQLSGLAGSPVTMNISSYQPGGVGYVAAQSVGLNGQIVITAPGRATVFQLDGLLGKDPAAHTFTLTAAGAMTAVSTNAANPYLVGRSIKKNVGDGRYYGLISDPSQGIQLVSWASDAFLTDTLHPITQIAPPVQSVPGIGFNMQAIELELAIQYGVSNGIGIPCPLFGLVGGTPVYISTSGSGLIPYVDMNGLSLADALQQLSVLVAGFFYLSSNGNYWIFRSRAAPEPGNTIGTNDQIDGDSGFLSLTVQPVSNKWAGYVSVQNENNNAIFGDTSDIAGSIAFKNADGQNLQLKSRFVGSSSHAIALAHSLYNYLGVQKRWIDINRIRDGRPYEIGRTFHCIADGVNRQFQIIESDAAVCGVSAKVVGLEV